MKGIEIRVPKLPGGYGVMIFPFCIVATKGRTERSIKTTFNHEQIHFQQALELGIIPFYFWIAYEYIRYGLFKGPAERECYGNQRNLDYLKTRKRYKWLR